MQLVKYLVQTMQYSKARLRMDIKEQIAKIACEKMSADSQLICRRLCCLSAYQKARRILFFLATKQEVCIDTVLVHALANQKEVYVPRCQAAGSMEAVRLYSLEETRIGMYGIRTVSDKRPPLATEALDLIMVPALAFDVKGHRLGHGGGYYDRFLARSGQALCIGVAWDCQVVAQVPIEPWDRGVNGILTPTRFLKITI